MTALKDNTNAATNKEKAIGREEYESWSYNGEGGKYKGLRWTLIA